MTLTVNGQPASPGCYVDGHWGQYGGDHLADQLEGFDIVIDRNDDPRRFRRIFDWCVERGGYSFDGPLGNVRLISAQAQGECATDLIDRANDVTEGGYWEWYDGECFLRSYVCPECGRDATNPTATKMGYSPDEPDDEVCPYCCDADDPGCFA